MSSFAEFYFKHAPRWVKVIRWREWGDRVIAYQKFLFWRGLIPAIGTFLIMDNVQAHFIAFQKPKTEEELMLIKQNCNNNNIYQRNWEMDQYEAGIPPLYDTWLRRKNYPEYYGNKYDSFRRYEPFGKIPKLPNYGKELVKE